jgi:hypothetical protein
LKIDLTAPAYKALNEVGGSVVFSSEGIIVGKSASEGIVQEYENYVRIIVSLINARVDQNVWFEIYDTILTNNFAIQSDIAKKNSR